MGRSKASAKPPAKAAHPPSKAAKKPRAPRTKKNAKAASPPPSEEKVEDDDIDEVGEVGIMSDTDSDEEEEWDEVKTNDQNGVDGISISAENMPNIPINGITIDLGGGKSRGGKRGKSKGDDQDDDDDVISKKRKKPELDLNEVVRKTLNKVKITEQLMKHKFSLLLYLARGLRLCKIVNCNIVRGLSLSITDSRFKIKGRLKERAFLEKFMEQFTEVVQLSNDEEKSSKHMQQPFMLNLLDCFSSLEATSLVEVVIMFIGCLKALKAKTPIRIINVLRPITMRADIIPKPDSMEEKKKSNSKSKGGKPKVKDDTPDEDGIVEKLDYWLEVYLSDEKKWCCVDLCNVKLDEPTILTELSRPFNYLVSFDVDRYCVKPAERNYCENWYTPGFKKGRCEEKWWDSVMSALGPAKLSDKDLADEDKTEEILTKQEMPTSDNGFRNHPLYVLEKHLLKFQGIYPPEVAPLGFFKDNPVYPRDCVQTLRSRETWLRQARTVKLGETPYKMVKARPKRDKYSGDLIRDLPLELFGEWQTEEYDPPTAADGKVPRNCYGNVDMYQECMLPKGCVWLKLPGLPRIANKLGVDCAAAVVGFDNHCGSYGAHPVMDGFIVCEEAAESLQMAWEEEQENARQREESKRSKRIWDNWKRLIKATMIREKLRVKYKHS